MEAGEAQKILVPVYLPLPPVHQADRVSSLMHGKGQWFISDPETGLPGTQTKIHILKPDRTEALIEAANGTPGVSSNEQESTCRLLGVLGLSQIQVEAAPVPID